MYSIRIVWRDGAQKGTITADNAKVVSPAGAFESAELEVTLDGAAAGIGGKTALVHVWSEKNPFSFLLRDVSAEYPILLAGTGVAVTTSADKRTYCQIEADVLAKGGKSMRQIMEEEPEYSYDQAAVENRDLPGPAWLGVSKDFRFFETSLRSKSSGNDTILYDYVTPKFFHVNRGMPAELKGREPRYNMMAGRGIGCRHDVTRRLEEGYMPILNAQNDDEGILYHMQFFATLESSPLDTEHLRGTDMYAADTSGAGNMLTEKQQAYADSILDGELNREEETVMYIKVIAENTRKAPAYSFVLLPTPVPGREYDKTAPKLTYDGENGFLSFDETGRICCICTVNGKPVPQEEMSVLLAPGEKITYIYKIPHSPLSAERAKALREVCYDAKFKEAKKFWENELADAAKITLPEKRIEEMIKAGLLHMDVGYFGKNPDGPVVPIVGVYTAIGSESSPGIQFLDSVGKHDLAARALQYFVEKQHEDGFMQNFGGYMLETGSALWSMNEHYRMTRDDEWAKSVSESVIKASEYIIRWREDNLGDELKGGEGYGMIRGKVADPEDHYHSFMLNAGAHGGLAGAAEMLANCEPEKAARIGAIAAEMRDNIRESFEHNLAKSPVMPAADGTWYRASAPWTEYPGPVSLYTDGGTWFSHGAFTIRDFISSAYLPIQGVVDPNEALGDEIVKYYEEYLTLNNTCFSQSYYSPLPYTNAMRGEVKPFLKEFYSGFASLADRETYSFWEHHFHASPHKLHEETWFLMRCRWMLMLEYYEQKKLSLLSMVPRKWLEDGQVICVEGMKSYFGQVNFCVESKIGVGRMTVRVNAGSEGFPAAQTLTVRLPHPEGKKAKYVTAGTYCGCTETVTIDNFTGCAEFELVF